MIVLLALGVIAQASDSSIVLFHDDFVSSPQYWILDSKWFWDNSQNFLSEYFYQYSDSWGSYETSTAISPAIYIPDYIEDVVVEFPQEYFVELGLYNYGSAYFKLQLFAEPYTGAPLELAWMDGSASSTTWRWADSYEVQVVLPASCFQPGEDLMLHFTGEAYACCSNWLLPTTIELDWSLAEVSVHGSFTTPLVRNTWASIKASMN